MITLGIDEVGRGCWAGPLVAAAVVLEKSFSGLNDSKVITKTKRTELAKIIYSSSNSVGLGWVNAEEVDNLGLTEAVSIAMTRALNKIKVPYDEIIIDGSYNFIKENPKSRAIIKADSLIPSVSAASIVAKVARDEYMTTHAHALYPEYEFNRHVGYGTRLHLQMLRKHGVSPLHRLSYKPINAIITNGS